jgi:hypothetical protein
VADETRKAASVGQLQELAKQLGAKIDQQSGAAAGVELAALRSLVESMAAKIIALEARLAEAEARANEPPAAPDFSPIASVIERALAEQAKLLQEAISAASRPVSKTGEATLPDGKKITLQVSESRN